MQNRKIRHLFTQSSTGRFFVETDLQTELNIKLLSENKQGIEAFSRLGRILYAKYHKKCLERLKSLSYPIGTSVQIIEGAFKGSTGKVCDITEGASGKTYISVKFDIAIGCPYVTGISNNELIKI